MDGSVAKHTSLDTGVRKDYLFEEGRPAYMENTNIFKLTFIFDLKLVQ